MGDGVPASGRHKKRSEETCETFSDFCFQPGDNEDVISSCATLGKLLNLSVLSFPQLGK